MLHAPVRVRGHTDPSHSDDRDRDRRRDSGSVLVESAIVTPIVLLLLIGVLEMGSLLRTYSTAANAARAAGRAASIAGADPMADRMVLARLQREAAGGFKGQITFVVIWHASGPGQGPPPGCIPASTVAPNTSTVGMSDGGTGAVGACNVYVRPEAPGGAFERVAAAPSGPNPAFGCQGLSDPQAPSKLDCAWPAKNRRAVTSPRTAAVPEPTDLIGVHVEFEHQFHTDLVSPSRTVKETVINLIEPVGYEFG